MNQPISLDRARDIKNGKNIGNLITLDEALDYIKHEGSVSMEQLVKVYTNTAVHVREDLRGLIAKNESLSLARKSMFFQVVHYVDRSGSQDEPSTEMLLAIYYGLKTGERKLEIDRLSSIFLKNTVVSMEQIKDLVRGGLTQYPYKFSGNECTTIIKSLEIEFISKRRSA